MATAAIMSPFFLDTEPFSSSEYIQLSNLPVLNQTFAESPLIFLVDTCPTVLNISKTAGWGAKSAKDSCESDNALISDHLMLSFIDLRYSDSHNNCANALLRRMRTEENGSFDTDFAAADGC